MLVRFQLPRLPLVDGRVFLGVELTGSEGKRYHRLERAAEFAVAPESDARGWFLFEGDWELERPARAVEEAEAL